MENNKSQEDFQKDILEILKKQGDKQEKSQEDVAKRLEKLENPEIKMVNQKQNEMTYVCSINSMRKTTPPQGEIQNTIDMVTREIAPIMEKYKICKLEMYLTKVYD